MAVELEKLEMARYSPETASKRRGNEHAVNAAVAKVKPKKSQPGKGPAKATSTGKVESAFQIEVRFLGGLTQSQQDIFELAATRWSEVITGDLPPATLPSGETVDDLLIDAQGVAIDGIDGILGQAGPQFLRPGSNLPVKGMMQFDSADLSSMEANGSLVDVIIHEMGHVLGIGTIWDLSGLVVGCQTANPVFLGDSAMAEFGNLIGSGPAPVPVANTGGPGTRCGHWRESVFGHELMTGFLNAGTNPLSRLTIASLADLGYEVDLAAADPYTIPTQIQMAMMGIGSDGHRQTCRMCGGGVRRINPVVLPESSLLG